MALTFCSSYDSKKLQRKIEKLVGNLDHYEPKVKKLFELSVCCEEDTTNNCTCSNAGGRSCIKGLMSMFTPTCRPPVPRVGRQTYRMWKALMPLSFLPFAKSRLDENRATLRFLPLELFNCSKICLPPLDIKDRDCFVQKNSQPQDSITIAEFLVLFLQAFFPGLEVISDEDFEISEMDPAPTSRFHKLTNKKQLLVTDIYKRLHFATGIDKKDYILGLTWTDLYPSEDMNFALGEALFSHRCAVFSFGRFEPLAFSQAQEVSTDSHNNVKSDATENGHSFEAVSNRSNDNECSVDVGEETQNFCWKDKDESDIIKQSVTEVQTSREDNGVSSSMGLEGGEFQGEKDFLTLDGELLWKMMRVSSHEVCHLFGLSHCVFFACAMNESKSVSEALHQPLQLCPVCLRKLQRFCGFDVVERYQKLLDICARVQRSHPCTKLKETVDWYSQVVNFLSEEAKES